MAPLRTSHTCGRTFAAGCCGSPFPSPTTGARTPGRPCPPQLVHSAPPPMHVGQPHAFARLDSCSERAWENCGIGRNPPAPSSTLKSSSFPGPIVAPACKRPLSTSCVRHTGPSATSLPNLNGGRSPHLVFQLLVLAQQLGTELRLRHAGAEQPVGPARCMDQKLSGTQLSGGLRSPFAMLPRKRRCCVLKRGLTVSAHLIRSVTLFGLRTGAKNAMVATPVCVDATAAARVDRRLRGAQGMNGRTPCTRLCCTAALGHTLLLTKLFAGKSLRKVRGSGVSAWGWIGAQMWPPTHQALPVALERGGKGGMHCARLDR